MHLWACANPALRPNSGSGAPHLAPEAGSSPVASGSPRSPLSKAPAEGPSL